MALTQQQFDAVEKVLSASGLDAQTIDETLRILKGNIKGGDTTSPPTPYVDIKTYTLDYKTALQERGSGIVQPDYENEMMITYMDRDRVQRVLDNVPADGYLAAMPGVHTDQRSEAQFTISLLATNVDFSFVEDNTGTPIAGEEVWGNFDILQNFNKVFK